MNDFHDPLTALIEQASLHQQKLEELDEAIREAEDRLGQWSWLRQETLRKLRDVIRQLAEITED